MIRNITLFLSSTFADMQTERDIIRERITPELADFMRKAGANVEFIDLRWGIDTGGESEQAASEKIIFTCFDEIKRTEPYFVVLLGERYGWIPPSEEVIAALNAENLQDNPAFKNKSITEMEIAFATNYYNKTDRCVFYLREPVDYGDDDNAREAFVSRGEDRERLEELRTRLIKEFPDRVFTYKATWDKQSQSIVCDPSFEKEVSDRLKGLFAEDFAETEAKNPVEESLTAHETFAEISAEGFAGRAAELSVMTEFLEGNGKALLVSGNSGSGKSKLLAKFAKSAQDDGYDVLAFFTNADNRSSSVASMLKLFLCKLKKLAGEDVPDDFAPDEETLRRQFYQAVSSFVPERKLVIVVDAINQLAKTEYENKLKWLNLNALNDKVKVVVSCTTDYYQLRYAQAVFDKTLDLDYFSQEDIRCVSEHFFRVNHKDAIPEIMDAIVAKGGKNNPCRMPIYLLTLLQKLNNIGADDFKKIEERKAAGVKADEAIVGYLSDMIRDCPPTVEKQLYGLLEEAGVKIGKEECEAFVCAIACSVYGMTEPLLEDALTRMGLKFESAKFSYFRKIFRSNLIQRETGAWDFNHNLIKQYCKSYFTNTGTEKRVVEAVLAALEARPADDLKSTEFARFCALADKTDLYAGYLGENGAKASLLTEMQNPDIPVATWRKLFDYGIEPERVRSFLLAALSSGSLTAKKAELFTNMALNRAYSDFGDDKAGKAAVALDFYEALGDLAVKYGYYSYAQDCLLMAKDLCATVCPDDVLRNASLMSRISDCFYLQGKTGGKNKYARKCRKLLKSSLDGKDENVAVTLVRLYCKDCEKKADSFFRTARFFETRINEAENILRSFKLSPEIIKEISILTLRMACLSPFRAPQCSTALSVCLARSEDAGYDGALCCLALSDYYSSTDIGKSEAFALNAKEKLSEAIFGNETQDALILYEDVLSALCVFASAKKEDNSALLKERASVLKKLIAQDAGYDYVEKYLELEKEDKKHCAVSDEELRDAKKTRARLMRGYTSAEQKLVNKMFRLAIFIVFAFYFIVPQIPIAFFANWVSRIFSSTGLSDSVAELYLNYLSASFQGAINSCLCFGLYGVICVCQLGSGYAMKRAWLKRTVICAVLMAALSGLYSVFHVVTRAIYLSPNQVSDQLAYTYAMGLEFCLLMLICAEFVELTGKENRLAPSRKNYERFVKGYSVKLTDTLLRIAALALITLLYILYKRNSCYVFMLMSETYFLICAGVIVAAAVFRIIRLTVIKFKVEKLYG